MIKCKVCGGTNVQVACWVRVNTNEVLEDYWSWNNNDGHWCEDCGEHTELVDTSIGKEREMAELVPPDLDRCQAEKPNGHSFMTLGGSPGMERCKDKPTVIATEKRPGKDGKVGSMSLCDHCKGVFIKQLGDDYATFEEINRG